MLTPEEWGDMLHSLECRVSDMSSIEFFCVGDVSLLPQLLTYTVIYLHYYELTGIYVLLWFITQYHIILFK